MGQGCQRGECGRWLRDRQAGPAGQTDGADAHGRREAGANTRAPNSQRKGGTRGRWGTRLIDGPPLSVAGERDAPGEAGRGLGCSAGLLARERGAGFCGLGRKEREATGLREGGGGSGRFLGLGWFGCWVWAEVFLSLFYF